MSSMVLELRRDALNSSNNLADLLRKALLVAKKLGIKDFQDWIISELNGYDDIKVIPKYRIVTGSIKALNPYQGWIPCLIPDNGLDFKLTQREVGQSIGALVSLLQNNKSGFLQTNYAPEVTQTLMSLFNTRFQIALHIDPSVISGILDAVRNTVLNWALKLEEEGILGEGMSFSKEEKEKALTSTSIHIENFQGILGNAENSTITQNLNMTVQKCDFNSLSDFLSKNGISTKDIKELRGALDSDPIPKSQTLGENVGAWLGKMVSKAASGVWKIGVDVATNLLANAIWAYYGVR